MPDNSKILYCDLETYSPIPITYGTHKYAEGAEILLFAWALGEGPVQVWDATEGTTMPKPLADSLRDPGILTVWHNGGMFDTVVLRSALGIDLPLSRVHDTMVQALSHALPGSLAALCKLYNLPTDVAKDKRGKKLIQLFCKPIPGPSPTSLTRASRLSHPEEWATFVDYASSDIKAMRALHQVMPVVNLTSFENGLWQLDQKINRRGFQVDIPLAQRMLTLVQSTKDALNVAMKQLTKDSVHSASQVSALRSYLWGTYSIALPDLSSDTVARALGDPSFPYGARELLNIRKSTAMSSTAKYATLVNATSEDSRLRGTLQFNGASRTGRWAGRLFQPQNLPKPHLSDSAIAAGITEVMANPNLRMPAEELLTLASSSLRSMIHAAPGNKLVASDLRNIEGRVLAWVAGETWKLKAFSDLDKGVGVDLYELAYARAFRSPVESVTPSQRQIGKVMELALGYGGGVGSFVTFSQVYSIDLTELAKAAMPALPEDVVEAAHQWWLVCREDANSYTTHGLTCDQFIVCDSLKRLWRAAHPKTVELWSRLEGLYKSAVAKPGTTYAYPKLKVRKSGPWLHIKLPSGRCLCYAFPVATAREGLGYKGVDSFSKTWRKQTTYGGKLVENVCQAISRDILAWNMLEVEKAGYPIVLTVHDEIIAETPDTDEYTHEQLSRILSGKPNWAKDIPLAAVGYESARYTK